MRSRVVVVLATVPLAVTPAALAANDAKPRRSICRVPDLDLSYETGVFTATVLLRRLGTFCSDPRSAPPGNFTAPPGL